MTHEPIRIGHCIHGLGIGGAQQVIRLIAADASPGEFEHVVYSCEGGDMRSALEAAGARVEIIGRTLPKLDPLWAVRLALAMRRDGVSVVHTHLFGDSLHGYLGARILGLPVVMTLHTAVENGTGFQPWGYRWLLDRVDRVVACAPPVLRSAAEKMVDPDAVALVTNGVEDPGEDPGRAARVRELLGLDAEATVVAAAGRLAPEKAYDVLIEAFAAAAPTDPRAMLVLVGDGPLRAALEERARSLGVERRVRFTGFRPDAAEILRGADVVAFSSLFEGVSMALLEAMSTGRCVVGTDIEGMRCALEPGVEALLAPAGVAAPLGEALGRVLAQPELRRTLGRAARRRYLAEFTAQRMVREYERLYGEALGEVDATRVSALPVG